MYPNYLTDLTAFITLLATHQSTVVPGTRCFYHNGRKYDKIFIDQTGNITVRYFVDNKTGAIYGAKSRFAPNLKHYFGTVASASKWDWSGFYGTPVNDPDVRYVGSYGGYKWYLPV